MAPPACFIRRSGVVATLFRRKLSALRLQGPNATPVFTRHLLALVPRRCRGHVIIRKRFCLGRRCGLGKVRLGNHGPGLPRKCGKRIDYSYRSLSRIGRHGSDYSCIFLDPMFGDVSGLGCGSTCATRRLHATTGTNVVSGGIVTLKNVSRRGLLRMGSFNFKKTTVLNTL